MRAVRRLQALIVCLPCLLASACSTGEPSPEAAAAVIPGLQLGRPSELPAGPARLTAFTDSERMRLGADFDPAAPMSRVLTNGQAAVFAPNWTGTGETAADLAYATWRFDLPGYADSPVVTLGWDVAPDNSGDVWVALANRLTDRWDLLPVAADNTATAESILPYLQDDRLLVAVIATGTDLLTLALVSIGDDAVPVAQLTATPDNGALPLNVELSGISSTDSDGEIDRYEFDLDGDGVYEIDNAADPDMNHLLPDAGSFLIGLRVTDDRGATATDVVTVSVNNPDMNPPVAALTGDPLFGDYPLNVTLDASGSTDDFGITAYDFDEDGNGVYEVESSTEPTHSFIYTTPGIRTAVVRVHDAQGSTDTADVAIDANAQPVVTMSLDPDYGRAGGDHILFGTGGEPGGSIVSMQFDKDGDGDYDASGSTVVVQYSSMGRYLPTVRVTDDDGETAVAVCPKAVYVTNLVESEELDRISPGAGCDLHVVSGEMQIGYHETGGTDTGVWFTHGTSRDSSTWARHKVSTVDPPNTSQLALSHSLGLSGATFPIMAFYRADGDLVCARAVNVAPDAADDWVVHTVDSSSTNFTGNFACDIATTGVLSSTRHLISYYDDGSNGDGELYFAVSEVAYPDEESDWTRHIVDGTGSCGLAHSMLMIQGKPCIAYYGGSARLRFARSTVALPDAAADWVIHEVLPGPIFYRCVNMRMIGGLPAIATVSDSGGGRYCQATSLTPGAATDWNVSQFAGLGAYSVDLAEYGGYPVVCRADFGFEPDFYWSREVLPDSYGDWFGDEELIDQLSSVQPHLSMGIFSGMPVIACYNGFGQVVVLMGE